MDPVSFLEQFGIPLSVACAFGYFIWKQNQFIQKELMEELDESFKRLEGIIIKLIDQQKITQMDIKRIKGYIEGIEDIMQRLTGGKLKINKEDE
tara:strand:+ start:137 stop:418 length:282 start_codon:yes stop_codon:yes gene_type:complete